MSGAQQRFRWAASWNLPSAVLIVTSLSRVAFSHSLDGTPSEWQQVVSAHRSAVLDLLADHIKANYERIRTWDVEYHVITEDLLSPAQLPMELRTEHEERETSAGLLQRVESTVHFVIDMETNGRYWSRRDPKLTWLVPDTHRVVSIPRVRVKAERSVCFRDEYIHFDPTNVVPAPADLPAHPAAQNKRVAYKDPVEDVRKQRERDLLDPRLFFGPDLPSGTYADYLVRLSKRAESLDDDLRVWQSEGRGGPWYRISVSMAGGGLATLICSPGVGFNPVLRLLSADNAGTKVLKRVQWRWQRFGEIYVSSEVSIVEYRPWSKIPTGTLKATLTQCVLNRPVSRNQFTYEALGLQDGDLVMDRVNRQFLVYEGGKLTKLADFGDKYVAGDSARAQSEVIARLLLAACSSGLLIIVAAILILRRVRSARN